MNKSTVLGLMPGRWTPPRWWVSTREFFAYHGVWAVGVRLLRSLSIRGKIFSVVLMAALPLAPMSGYLIHEQSQIVSQAERRIAGAHLAAAVQQLTVVLEDKARRLERGEAIDRELMAKSALALRQARGPATRHGLALTRAWEAVDPALARLDVGIVLSPQGLMEGVSLARAALASLREQTVRESGFLLVAEPDRFAQVVRAFVQLPRLGDELWALHRGLQQHAAATVREGSSEWLAPSLVEALGRLETFTASARLATPAFSTRGLSEDVVASAEELLTLNRVSFHAKQYLLNDGQISPAELETLRSDAMKASNAIAAMQGRLLGALTQDYAALRDHTRLTRVLTVSGTVLSLLMALYLFYSFYLVMRGGLVTLTEQARRMSTGDLTVRRRPRGGDEVAETMQAVSLSVERLGELLAQVRYGSSSVSQAAQQIANGNVDLRTRNHRTSEALQNVVDGVARYSAQLEACSVQVERVVSTVQALRLQSARSRRQMDMLTATLAQVRSHSQQITESVSLIDNVAFRTNILALNASVEASKAGEAGKGFAVVAQEVRSLAQRSAEAARRIGSIVASSGTHVEQSAQLAEDTGRGIAESDAHIDLIHGAMADVSSLTRDGQQESSAILEQVRSLRETTEKNLGLVEQLANASHSLRSHGERLTHRLSHFKLG
jgi:methyl-accepting chemotaxis protein